MQPLNSTLIARSPFTALIMCGLLGFGTTPFLLSPLDDLPMHGLWAFLIGTAIWVGILRVTSAWISPRVDIDLAGRRLRVRGREYSFSSLRTVTRRLSTNRSRVYLTFRFALDDGRGFRVLAHGRPFKGLTLAGLDLLHGMVQASNIEEPHDLSPHQQRVSSTLQKDRAIPVGRAAILSDIDELRATMPAPTADAMTAAARIQEHTGALHLLRRVGGITVIVAIVAVVGLQFSFPIVEDAGITGWSAQHPIVDPLNLAGSLVALTAAIVWMLSADAWVRRVRRLGDAWWDAADSAARNRGLPLPYLRIDATGARRTWNSLAVTALLLTVMLVVVTVEEVSDETSLELFALTTIAAVAFISLGIFSWRRSRRDSRQTAERIAARCGQHVGVLP